MYLHLCPDGKLRIAFLLLIHNDSNVDTRRFHAIDNPVTDPVSVRRARSSSTLNKSASASAGAGAAPKSPSTPKLKLSSKWVPFSQRDSAALEKAYQVIKDITLPNK